ncbi:hypothetical protein [Peribacillus frigoritolerans]|uniref:hypothetical protein n=1 Tax=Peribacillus frigoritolerans TaxID=450367 RepID=UPI00227FADC9|nr:hypothetical protein [Peribacillus frigoritolerans]MCY9140605.1 hypothetical protein [Peribacillus frigoritolerans]
MKDKKLNQGKLGKWNEIDLVTIISNGKIISHDIHQKLHTVIFQSRDFLLPWFLWSKVSEEHKSGTRISL